jgi:DNA repair exonuclease SbcCD ATPase subunit
LPPLNLEQKALIMKKLFTLGLLVISAATFAQDKITVKEEMVAIDGTSRNSLTVILSGSETDDVKKAWKKQLKELKGKISDKTIIFGDDCVLKELGDNSFDVYSIVEEAIAEEVRLVVAFDLGGAHLSTAAHPAQYPAAEKFVYGFALAQGKNVVSTEIETSQKVLKSLEKDQIGLEKDKEKLEKDIKDYEAKIEENKVEIEQNVANQTDQQNEIHRLEESQIEGQIEEVQKVIKEFNKELDGLVKDKKRIEKDNQNLLEKIKKANADMKENQTNQTTKKTEVEASKGAIQTLEVKLRSIH